MTLGPGETEPTCESRENDLDRVREASLIAGQPCSSSSIRD